MQRALKNLLVQGTLDGAPTSGTLDLSLCTVYLPANVSSGDYKQSVRVATTTNGTISTAFANGQTVDGITLATGDRILLKDQSSQAANGIYVVAASGSPARASDFDSWLELPGAVVTVEVGTVNAGTQWACNVAAGGTIGSTAITFTVPKNYLDLTSNQTVAGIKTFSSAPVFTDASGTRTALGLAIGTNVQAYDADLTTWAGITPGADVGTFLATPSSANLRSAITDENGTGALLFSGATSPDFTTSITTGSATFALLNTTATTVNAFGAADRILITGANTTGNNTAAQLSITPTTTTGTVLHLKASSRTTGKIIDVLDDGTAAQVFNTKGAVYVNLTGAQSTASCVSLAGEFINSKTGTTNTNFGLRISASGATTNNALHITAGNSLFPDGLESAPSIQFGLDTDTGIYRIGTNNIGIATNGTLRWHVSSAGSLFSGSGNYDYNIGAALVLGSSGTASAPTFTFGSSADTNTGMYRVSEDQIGFTAGGTLRATINTTDLILTVGLTLPKTITAGGTTGAQTINKTSGSVNFAGGTGSLVVTNSLVTTSSVILVTGATNDGDQSLFSVVAAAGSFTIYPGIAGTSYQYPYAETRVNFLVLN
tara:strand:- start:320 stop:2125 length:1806 start_codon:yes stop_codon:yes gene_type:complete